MIENESGITTIEYVIILIIIAIAFGTAWQVFGHDLSASISTPSELIRALGHPGALRELFPV